MSETSVKIKVQHDHNIHHGICTQNCPFRSPHRSLSKVMARVYNRKEGEYPTPVYPSV